jgi:hypothetical protein
MTQDPVTTLHLRILNILARVVGVVFVLTGIGLLFGAITAGSHFIEFASGLFALISGILFLRVRKATRADMDKYFGRRD